MAFLNSLNIVGSALTAERFRSNIILQNIANQTTTRTENGEPYRRKQVIFHTREMSFDDTLSQAIGGGVRVAEVVESQEEFTPVYDPDNPDADEEGYVYYPNVNNTEEQVDLLDASRVYEANISALSVVKAMAAKALEIGKN
ncbi:MAG: flagellar basal body rod protein FlgC [Clostridium sp.]|nr:flagellar basal body rod protein FlgC [Clostridium sp.]MCM1547576.1 flagellar basal body rod protein FlgC [Ruminococcus sp.]